MNSRFPAVNPYQRPAMFGVGQPFGLPSTYGANQQWPAATSTELWTHQQQLQFQSITTSQNSWDPALPISNNMNLNMIPTQAWNPMQQFTDPSRQNEYNKK